MNKTLKDRIGYSIGLLSFLSGGGLWLQQVIVLYSAANLTGPVEGPFATVGLRVFIAGLLLVIGTYFLTMYRHIFYRAVMKDLQHLGLR